MLIKRWQVAKENPGQIQMLEQATGLPALVCSVLAARGCSDEAQAREFIDEKPLDDPFALVDMDKAVRRILSAIECGERIAVYGDFDCDGICSTALLVHYLQSVGADVFYYIPARELEGYGMNLTAVKVLADMQTGLIITVDNGISAHDEIDYAAALGMDVVVTDHHTPRETMPNAAAVVNPHRADCPSRFKGLAGAGVAFKLICALEGADAEELLEYYSELVALATVADLVPLVDENRTIVRHGLAQMAGSARPGINALLEVSGIVCTGEPLTSTQVAFALAPRINAAGRMEHVDDAVQLLLTDDVAYAKELAELLDNLNNQRKAAEAEIVKQAELTLEARPELLRERVLLLAGEDWHPGVIGIVASRMVERYARPCILFSICGGEARGSGRSVEGFSLIGAVAACGEPLTRYGGHSQAAGMSLPAGALDDFGRLLQAFAREHYPVMPVPVLPIERVLEMRELTTENAAALSLLEPFGVENPAPRFLLAGVRVAQTQPTADGKHLRALLEKDGGQVWAICFNSDTGSFAFLPGEVVDTVIGLGINRHNGAQYLSVQIKDIRPEGLEQDELLESWARYRAYQQGECKTRESAGALIPTREETATVYRALRQSGGTPDKLYMRLLPHRADFARMMVSLEVMVELGLAKVQKDQYTLEPNPGTVDLENSVLLQNLREIS